MPKARREKAYAWARVRLGGVPASGIRLVDAILFTLANLPNVRPIIEGKRRTIEDILDRLLLHKQLECIVQFDSIHVRMHS